jgi:hypothetical protein
MKYHNSDQVGLKTNYFVSTNDGRFVQLFHTGGTRIGPTFVAMEMAWRMGKMIGKRGEAGEEEAEEKNLVWRSM